MPERDYSRVLCAHVAAQQRERAGCRSPASPPHLLALPMHDIMTSLLLPLPLLAGSGGVVTRATSHLFSPPPTHRSRSSTATFKFTLRRPPVLRALPQPPVEAPLKAVLSKRWRPGAAGGCGRLASVACSCDDDDDGGTRVTSCGGELSFGCLGHIPNAAASPVYTVVMTSR